MVHIQMETVYALLHQTIVLLQYPQLLAAPADQEQLSVQEIFVRVRLQHKLIQKNMDAATIRFRARLHMYKTQAEHLHVNVLIQLHIVEAQTPDQLV